MTDTALVKCRLVLRRILVIFSQQRVNWLQTPCIRIFRKRRRCTDSVNVRRQCAGVDVLDLRPWSGHVAGRQLCSWGSRQGRLVVELLLVVEHQHEFRWHLDGREQRRWRHSCSHDDQTATIIAAAVASLLHQSIYTYYGLAGLVLALRLVAIKISVKLAKFIFSDKSW